MIALCTGVGAIVMIALALFVYFFVWWNIWAASDINENERVALTCGATMLLCMLFFAAWAWGMHLVSPGS